VAVEFASASLRRLIGFCVLLSFLFFFFGVRLARGQQQKIERLHGQRCRPGGERCDLDFSWKAKKQVFKWNAVLSLISFILALYFAFSSVPVRKTATSSQDHPLQNAVQLRSAPKRSPCEFVLTTGATLHAIGLRRSSRQSFAGKLRGQWVERLDEPRNPPGGSPHSGSVSPQITQF